MLARMLLQMWKKQTIGDYVMILINYEHKNTLAIIKKTTSET